jgi:hypothetical protein
VNGLISTFDVEAQDRGWIGEMLTGIACGRDHDMN